MVKIRRISTLLTKAEIETAVRMPGEKVVLGHKDGLNVSLPNDKGVSVVTYKYVLEDQGGKIKIELNINGYYKVDGFVSEEDVRDLCAACYEDIFGVAKAWIEQQAPLMWLNGLDIQMDPGKREPEKVDVDKKVFTPTKLFAVRSNSGR